MPDLISESAFVEDRYEQLVELLGRTGGVVVALSGGVDSSLLLVAAHDALGDRCLALTARSPMYAERETAQAIETANWLGARHRVIDTGELALPGVQTNPTERCYHCKHDKLTTFLKIARQEGLGCVIEGSNNDDLGDYRPGLKAVSELEVRSPFIELGWGKTQIRTAARQRGLPNWDRPSTACLASRVPYGQPLTVEKLKRIEQAEQVLFDIGLRQVRVRDHGQVARIEIEPAEFGRLLDDKTRTRLVEQLKQAGYVHVALDLIGYRTGAMNEALNLPAGHDSES